MNVYLIALLVLFIILFLIIGIYLVNFKTRDIVILNIACVFVVLIVVFIILYFKNENDTEHFKSIKEKRSTWKSRIAEIKKVPLHYLSYFTANYPRVADKNIQLGKIFVSIASYRDDQCSDTVTNLINGSDNPENLVICICQQNGLVDEDCLTRIPPPEARKGAKVIIERFHHLKARGPVWARYKIQQHWQGEEYYLQLDSHTRLIKSWDTILKNQLSLLPNPDKSVLTQYPNEYKNIRNKNKRNDPIEEQWDRGKLRGGMYIQKIEKEGFTRIQSDYTTEGQRVPFKSYGWAAGFSFSKGRFIADVPIDPYLFLFFGEQMDIAIRAFTSGYDLYSPSVEIAYHIYSRDHRKTFWELTHQKPLEVLSRFRLYYKLGMIKEVNIPKEYRAILNNVNDYGLGSIRTLEEYEKDAGANLREEELIVY